MTSLETALLLLRVIACAMVTVISGIDLSFNVYAVTLKQTFNLTQTQVEIAASMGCIGFGLSMLEVVMTGLYGITATFLVTWISLPLSAGLFSLAAVYREFFHSWPQLIYFFQLYVSTSNAMSFMVVTRVCLQLIPDKYTATYLGIFGALICFGKIFLAALFSLFFQDDFKGFFLCFGIISVVLLSFCYLLIYSPTLTTYTKTPVDDPTIKQDGNHINMAQKTSRIKDMFTSRFFHMMLWSSAVFSSAGYTILNNITTLTDSLGMTDPFQIVTIISLSIMVARLVYGLIFDRMQSMTCGFGLLFSTYLTLGMGLILGLFLLNTRISYFMTLLFGFSIGPALTLPLGILVVHYGQSMYSVISSCLFCVVAVSELLLQLLTGYLYDMKSYQQGKTDNSCSGSGCFYWSFVALLTVTVVCGIVQVINFIQTTCQTRKDLSD